MGADLILSTWWTSKPDAIDWTRGEEEIAKLTVVDVDEYSFDELPGENGEDEDDVAYMDRVIRPQLRSDLAEVRTYWEGATGSALTYQFGPVKVLISGTSWGDDPSEMFTVMTRIPDSVGSACGFFV